MFLKKYISAIIVSLFLINLALADTSTSYEIDVSDSNSGGTTLSSSSFKANTAILGFVDGNFGYSTSYTLGSGLPYLELLCGNNILEYGEQCDDGNTTSGDGCSNLCRTEVAGAICGNGTVESGEQCDDGNLINNDGCSSACSTEGGGGGGGNPNPFSWCGNGVIEATEQCDDGNATSGDGCDNSCKLEVEEEPEEEEESIFDLPEEEEELKPAAEEDADKKPRNIKIKAKPEKRVRTDNWELRSHVLFYHKQTQKVIKRIDIQLNDKGWSLVENMVLPDGTYDIALKGLSHLTLIKRSYEINDLNHTIDFTSNDRFFLTAGDVHETKDDYVNGLDISATINRLYTSNLHADLNRDGLVNALDISIVVGNIYQYGEKLRG